MRVQNRFFETDADIIEFIRECENSFDIQIDQTIELLASKSDKRFYTLSGPSCSGKTTTASRIVNGLAKRGIKVFQISIDDFYKDRFLLTKELKEGQAPDYDSVNATDLDYLEKCLSELFNRKTVMMPRYSFTEGKIIEHYSLDPCEYDVFLFEGIQAVYPEITRIFKSFNYLSLYINVPEDICTNGSLFKGKDVRLMRRVVRDYNHRGADPEFSFLLWENVVKNERLNITPYAKDCDLHLSSLLDYEINVIKKPFLDILDKMPSDARHINKANYLRKKLDSVQEFDVCHVPPESMFNEFVR